MLRAVQWVWRMQALGLQPRRRSLMMVEGVWVGYLAKPIQTARVALAATRGRCPKPTRGRSIARTGQLIQPQGSHRVDEARHAEHIVAMRRGMPSTGSRAHEVIHTLLL